MGNCNRKLEKAQEVDLAMARHDRLVHAFIRRQGGGEITYEEALQAGRIGLWRALGGYDEERGTAFSTYAWVAICNEIRRRVQELGQEEHKQEKAVGAWQPPVGWSEMSLESWVDGQFVQEALLEMVRQLPERLQRVIVGRYGLGEAAPCTLRELGGEMGVSRERVRQLQLEALAWLRHPGHSWRLRLLVEKNTPADYRQALAENAALRRAQRRQR